MILEGIVTSLDERGAINVAPMGPLVDEDMRTLVLRPFQTSSTYRNLKQHPQGVFHVVDDVLLLARATINRLDAPPPTFPAERVRGAVLAEACRWYEFEIDEFDDTAERTRLVARVAHTGRIRDFFGFNRAKHAVLEAAILASRVHILARAAIMEQLDPLRPLVEKTAGPREREAFDLLVRYIDDHFAGQS